MNLKTMNDEGLMKRTDSLVREDRELLTSILYHFLEIERRPEKPRRPESATIQRSLSKTIIRSMTLPA